jgi:GAF domain-containing protein
MTARGRKAKGNMGTSARRAVLRAGRRASSKSREPTTASLKRALAEALEQQIATSEVLKVISESPSDLKPVFKSMLRNATQFCEAKFGLIYHCESGRYRLMASHNTPRALADHQRNRGLFQPMAGTSLDRLLKLRKVIRSADDSKAKAPSPSARLGGARSHITVPMLKDNELVGAIVIFRQEARPFSRRQIELVQNFAAQAVIAIENTRLLNELRQRTDDLTEALERQTATSEVLKVISSSHADLSPVFQVMLENATRICEAKFGHLQLYENGRFHLGAEVGTPPKLASFLRQRGAFAPAAGMPLARVLKTKRVCHTRDVTAEAVPGAAGQFGGARSMVIVPMLKDDQLIGTVTIYRQEVRPFTDKQIELVQNFAAQAVIAIENTRLLNELGARTDDLTEALEQQTATSEVLKVISSSPGDLEPIFQAMLENATRVCAAKFGTLWLCDGDEFRYVAQHGAPSAYVEERKRHPVIRPGPSTGIGRAIRTGQPVHIADVTADRGAARERRSSGLSALPDLARARTVLCVPLLKDNRPAGVIVIYRQEVRPFGEKQIELVQNFAAQAVIAIENARLLNELRQRTDDLSEALEQQTATSEVLRVISSSPGDLEPVFEAILDNATHICEANFGNLLLAEGDDRYRHVALRGAPSAYEQSRRKQPVIELGPKTPVGRCIRGGNVVHIADVTKEPVYLERDPSVVFLVEKARARTALAVPMLKDGKAIGAILIYRQEVMPFTEKQVELVQNFAAQAVIAIENTRLLNELRHRTDDLSEALEQQIATSEVLKAISSSPGDLQPIFNAMLENATRVCEAKFGMLFRLADGMVTPVASLGVPQPFLDFIQRGPQRPSPNAPITRAATLKQVVHVADFATDPAYIERNPMAVAGVELAGVRTLLVVPMLKENEFVGAFAVFRQEVRPFTGKQIELVQNFAAQAVIAIENTRLLNELRQRTDALTEALEQQTASSEVLDVISNSLVDIQPVFDAIVRSGLRLFADAAIVIMLPQGDQAVIGAIADNDPVRADGLKRRSPIPLQREYMHSLAIIDGKTVDVPDVNNPPPDLKSGAQNFRAGGFNAVTIVPMMRSGAAIGALSVARVAAGPLSPKQHSLLETFAAQAVIAIENTRLLNELRQRTDDLTETLEQQTATANVLGVINRSAFDLQPVFETVAESCVRLCGADRAFIFRFDGEILRMVAAYNSAPKFVEWVRQHPIRPGRQSGSARAALERRTIHIPDVLADPEYSYGAKAVEAIRTILGVPILKGDELLGVMMIYRLEVRPFTDKQIALVETFADQAAIAIENVRLFDEVQKRTEDLAESLEQQTATAEVLKVISSSAFDLKPVLDTIVETAARLCDAEFGVIFRLHEGKYHSAASNNAENDFLKHAAQNPIPPGRGSLIGRTAMEKRTIHLPDCLADPEYTYLEYQSRGKYRSMLGVPLLRQGEPIGVIGLMRTVVRPFTDKQIELVTTFADQAVIAIENVRLFEEIQDKSRQIAEASQHKSQFLANMSHELRTPLNAILGYTELIQDAVYGEPPDKMKAVLDRISRNGKHLLGLINDVLDLSKIEAGQLVLSLDSYSIRDVVHNVYSAVESLAANKSLALRVEMAPDLPSGRGDERRLTQVLLNLVGNAIKFTDRGEVSIKASATNGSYNLAVHDTGPGISETDQKKLFQEFQQANNSTTKAKGGTGLGLAISRRIIEMHGGRIWVESQLGQGSTFAMTLPIQVEHQARQP